MVKVKNIYKSIITTTIGTSFLISDVVYFLKNNTPDKTLMLYVAGIGVALLFISDSIFKKIVNFKLNGNKPLQ